MHNYLKKIERMGLDKLPGDLYGLKVEHDDHCEIFRFGECNCDPEITVST